jgi:hypothetical protein
MGQIYDILPNTNLRASDIMATLNANGGFTDEKFSSLFKATANHNMWSRFKPVSHSAFFLDGDGRWKGEDGRCGLTIPIYTSPSGLLAYQRVPLNAQVPIVVTELGIVIDVKL